jgi:hypothetical protein
MRYCGGILSSLASRSLGLSSMSYFIHLKVWRLQQISSEVVFGNPISLKYRAKLFLLIGEFFCHYWYILRYWYCAVIPTGVHFCWCQNDCQCRTGSGDGATLLVASRAATTMDSLPEACVIFTVNSRLLTFHLLLIFKVYLYAWFLNWKFFLYYKAQSISD